LAWGLDVPRTGFKAAHECLEVHASVRRAAACRLSDPILNVPLKESFLEFLEHGIKYMFPAKLGEPTRGMPTSYAAEPLKRLLITSNEQIPVWPDPNGKARGYSFEPLYRSASAAAREDKLFYEMLALTDALRDVSARDRHLAMKEMAKRITSAVSAKARFI